MCQITLIRRNKTRPDANINGSAVRQFRHHQCLLMLWELPGKI
jgi:hypothetical protein